MTYVPPGTLVPNPWNSNVVGPEMEKRLEASIRRNEVYKPIIVRELEDGTLQILGGQHRAQVAARIGVEEVPIINLGRIPDKKAKEIGLADNGRYGEDDALKLAAILKDIGGDAIEALPFNEQDLAGIFAAESINLDDIGIDAKADAAGAADLPSALDARPTITHELMRFKVPVEDQERVKGVIDRLIKREGLSTEKDSLVAAGMALSSLAKLAEEQGL